MPVTRPLDELVTHRMVEVGDVRLHVAEAGTGPLVLLLHGFPEFWYSWRHQIPVLAEAGYRVVAPDLRGYGQSDKPTGLDAYSVKALTGDVAGLIRALGEQRATVVGHDWGGSAAWVLGVADPELVDRLVICNAPHPAVFAKALRDPLQLLRFSYMAFFQVPALPEALLGARDAAGLRWFLRAASTRSGAFADEDLERYAEAFAEPGALTGALAYYRSMGRALLDRRGAAPPSRPVQAPTMVIWGTGDQILPLSLADPGRRRVPDLRLEPIEGAGHFVQSDAPDRVNTLLLDFLPKPS